MMDYSVFMDVIQGIKNTEEWIDEISEAFERTKLFSDYVIIDSASIPAFNALWDSLASSFSEEQLDLISWWIYENVEKKVWHDDGSEYELNTERDLFNYLNEHMEGLKY